MKKTNVTYVRKAYGVNPDKRFVKCVLDYEINLDKIPCIQFLAQMPEFEDFINTLVYKNGVHQYDCDNEGWPSEYGVLSFTTEGVANCADSDDFDEDLGKKLALTRAQKQAFQSAERFYWTLTDMFANVIDESYNLCNGCRHSAVNCKMHEYELTGHTPNFNYINY